MSSQLKEGSNSLCEMGHLSKPRLSESCGSSILAEIFLVSASSFRSVSGGMQKQRLKLKQASAVLQIEPKELQSLVQFGVVKPKRFEGTYFFDTNTLLVAKVVFCLKESFGTRTSVLSKLMDVFLASEKEFKSDNPKYIVFGCRLSAEEDPIKVGAPFRALGQQLQEQMTRADLYRDLPRGRKRPGWKKEFLESLTEAAKRSAKSRMRKSCRQFAPTLRKDKRRRSRLSRKGKKRTHSTRGVENRRLEFRSSV
jgi:hypothetical protein